MCGCSSRGSGFTASSSGATFCSGQYSQLQDARNKLATMFNIERDPVKKAKLKEDRDLVEQLLLDSANGSCPDNETVILIVTEVNNEYAKYYNT